MDEKKTFKQKIKAFLKKYWSWIASFIAGISASVFYFLRISGRFNLRDNDFRQPLDKLTTGLGRTESGLQGVEDRNQRAMDSINRQQDRIDAIEERHSRVESSSQSIGESIQRLKNLIEREREKTTKTGD